MTSKIKTVLVATALIGVLFVPGVNGKAMGFGIIARVVIAAVAVFVFDAIERRVPHKLYRFALVLLACLSVVLVLDYSDVRLLGRHEMGLVMKSIFVIASALLVTYWPQEG